MKHLMVSMLSLLCPGTRLTRPELTGLALEDLLGLLAEWGRKADLFVQCVMLGRASLGPVPHFVALFSTVIEKVGIVLLRSMII